MMDYFLEEQLDYGEDEEFGSSQQLQFQGGDEGTIPALVEQEKMKDEDGEYDDLYNDVNVGQNFGDLLNQDIAVSELVSDCQLDEREVRPVFGRNEAENKLVSGDCGGFERDNSVNTEIGQTYFSASVVPNVSDDPKSAAGTLLTPKYAESSDAGKSPLVLPNQPTEATASFATVDKEKSSRISPIDSNASTILYVGELNWWTSDEDLECVLSQFGRVKEITFFDDRANGNSAGYCKVEFYDAAAAAACKERINGYVFNGRPCVVSYASPQTSKTCVTHTNNNKTKEMTHQQGRRQIYDKHDRCSVRRNYFERGSFSGRGRQGFPRRGQCASGKMRGRDGFGPRGIGGAASAGWGAFPQGPMFGGPVAWQMHQPSAAFGPYIYGGGPAGMVQPIQGFGTFGAPGFAPYMNPAFFGHGMPASGIGVMGGSGMEGYSSGMWHDAGKGEHRRTSGPSYRDKDVVSDYGCREASYERSGRLNGIRAKERNSEREWSCNTNKKQCQEWGPEGKCSDRQYYRDDKDEYAQHKRKNHVHDAEDEWDREHSSSKSRSRSSTSQEEGLISDHSRDDERRCLTP